MLGRTGNHERSCQKKTRSRICGTQTPDGHGTNRATKSHCRRIGNRKIYGAKRKSICHSSIGYSKKREQALKKWVTRLKKHAGQPVKNVIEKAEKYEQMEHKMNQLRLQDPVKAVEIESLFHTNKNLQKDYEL